MIIDFVRKHLVLNFSQLIGQEVVVRFLKNTLYKNYFFPLYLFSGPRGTGKTSSARLLATAYFCEKYPDFCHSKGDVIVPCHTCATCIETVKGKNPNLIEIDAASNTGVDNIRALIENAYLMPINAEKKFYIIDEAHMLSKSAFNACLKIMEEPPEHVHFIMATTEPQKIIDTIRSRSIHLHFTPLSHDQLAQYICSIAREESVELDYSGAYLISTVAEGSIRDALNTLTKLCIIYGNNISEEVVRKNCGIITKETINALIDCVLYFEKEKFALIVHELKHEPVDKKILFERIVEYILEKVHAKEEKNSVNFMQLLYKEAQYFLESCVPLYILETWMYILHNHEKSSENYFVEKKIINHEIPKNDLIKEPLCESKINNIVLLHEKTLIDTSNIFKGTSVASPIDLHNSFDSKIDCFFNELMNKEKAVGAILKSALIKYDSSLNIINCYFDPHVSFYIDFINNKIDIIKPILQSFFDPTVGLHCSILSKPRDKEEFNVKPAQQMPQNSEPVALSNAFNAAKVINIPEKKTGYQQTANSAGLSKYGFIKKKVMPSIFTKGSLGEEIVKTFPGITYEEKNNIK